MSENLPDSPITYPPAIEGEGAFDWLTTESMDELNPLELSSVASKLVEMVRVQESRLRAISEIGLALSSTLDLDELLVTIMEKITELMGAERSTLFLLDTETNELWSKISQGVENAEIRVKVGEGIAGSVAETGHSMNIPDAYAEPRFSSNHDAQSGFKTRNMLCQPIRNREERIIGVVQVLNSRHEEFSAEDERLLSVLASQAAIAIENSRLYQDMFEKNQALVQMTERLEHKVAELDLLYDLEQKLSRVDNLQAMVSTITKETAEVLEANGAALVLDEAEHLTYYINEKDHAGWELKTRYEFKGQGLSDRVITTGAPFLCNSGDCAVPGTSGVFGFQIHNVIAVPLVGQDQKVIGAMKVFNRTEPFGLDDLKWVTMIANRIAAALLRRRQEDELHKSARLATVGQMLSGVIHDLKNPFAIINGYVQLMVRAEDRTKRDEFAKIIARQFDHLNQMTGELLNFSKGESHFSARDVCVARVFEEIEMLLAKELAQRNVRLVIHCHYQGQARLDDGKLKRAVLNLGRNAADAMPDGGDFVIDVRVDESKDELVMRFRDTGKGIPEAVRDTLFEPFVTKGKDHGTGLGLAIVKQIVDVHHGTIEFESTLNQGTTFIVRIPRMASELLIEEDS